MLILAASSHESSNKLTKHVSHCLNTESTRQLSNHKIINSFETVYIGLYFFYFGLSVAKISALSALSRVSMNRKKILEFQIMNQS